MPIDRNALAALIERVERGETGRELDAAIMFDVFAKPVGKSKIDGGPSGYLWPEDNASWSFGIRFPGKSREWFNAAKREKEGTETLLIERDDALVLMNSLRIPKLTTSIDAHAALPGDICEIHGYLSDKNEWTTWRARVLSIAGVPVWGVGPTECAARLATKLRAIMEAQDE